MPYLKHKTTGEVFPLNEHLLKRGDFVEIESLDDPLPAVETVELQLDTPKAKAERKPRARKPEPAPSLLDDLDVPE